MMMQATPSQFYMVSLARCPYRTARHDFYYIESIKMSTQKNSTQKLVYGLADRYLKQVGPLLYDGEELLAEDVVELMLPSMLVYSRELFLQLGLIATPGEFPVTFQFTDDRGMSPLQASFDEHGSATVPFVALASGLVEIFEVDLLSWRHDLGQFIQAAGRLAGLNFI